MLVGLRGSVWSQIASKPLSILSGVTRAHLPLGALPWEHTLSDKSPLVVSFRQGFLEISIPFCHQGPPLLISCCCWFTIKQTLSWGTQIRVEVRKWPLGSCLACSFYKPHFIHHGLLESWGHSAASCCLPTWGPWEGSPGWRPCNCCRGIFLNLPGGCYWEFNWSISHFLLRALERLILLPPNSVPLSYQAFQTLVWVYWQPCV